MQDQLFGTWGPQILAYGHQHRWRGFAAMLVGAVVLDLMFANDRSDGDSGVGGWDFGDGNGCAD
jgi:hypothetical protein